MTNTCLVDGSDDVVQEVPGVECWCVVVCVHDSLLQPPAPPPNKKTKRKTKVQTLLSQLHAKYI